MFGDFTSSGSFAEIFWSPRDSIKVFTSAGSGQEGLKYVTVEGGKTAVFECKSQNQQTIPSGSLGLYPYSQDATASFASSTKIETIIPSVQHAFADTFDPCALLSVGVATAEDRMVFYNICSGICFTLQSSDYSRIVFKGANSELIAGAVSISMSKPESPSVTPVSQGAEKEIVLEAPDGGTFATDSRYYIMLRPGDFSKGFSMEFYSPNSQQPVVCTCSSFVSFKRGVFAFVSDVDNPEKLAAIRDASSLADLNGPANCYIISKAGTYKFPLVRGNDPDDALAGVSKVEVLWETDNTNRAVQVGSIISESRINGSYVFLHTPQTLKNGNALVAVYRGNDIVWSWHIWVLSDYDPEAEAQTLKGKLLPMMDRNLGALSNVQAQSLTNGLFYQWGRKDPFPGAVEVSVPGDTGAGSFMLTTASTRMRVHFKLNWNDNNQSITVTKSTEAVQKSNASATIWLYISNTNELVGLYPTGSDVYEITMDVESNWGFEIRSSASSTDRKYRWGGTGSAIKFGEPFALSNSNGAGDIIFSVIKTALSTDINSTVEYSIAHPDVYITSVNGCWLIDAVNSLWGITSKGSVETAVKSIYDPCPPGWKVPRARVMSGTLHVVEEEAWVGVHYNQSNQGVKLDTEGEEKAWYPNNGYISRDGILLMVGQYSCYWSCNPYAGGQAFAMQMSKDMAGNLTYNPLQYGKLTGEGHSVRCIKDN